jgi:hypothetical protein
METETDSYVGQHERGRPRENPVDGKQQTELVCECDNVLNENVRAPGGKQNVLGTAEGDCGTGKVELSDG